MAMLLMFLANFFRYQKPKTLDLRRFERGIDYFIDFAESSKTATLTTAIKLKKGDKVKLFYREETIVYSVEKLESYWNDDSIQTILLEKI